MVLLVAGAVIVGWGPRLFWGLWLDETFTAWQAEGGWTGIFPDKLTNPGQSALYAYLEAAFYFPHSKHMELWLRLPSLAGAAASCWFLFRLTEALVGKGTGFFAVVAFAGNPSVLFYTTQARPYTLAIAACLGCLWGLLQWLATGARRHGLTFSVSLALVLYLHIMFVVFALVPALLLIGRAQRGEPVNWRGLMRWLGVTAVVLLPLVWLLSDFPTRSAGLSPFRLPRLAELAQALVPGSVLYSLVAFSILLVRNRQRGLQGLTDAGVRPVLTLSLAWLLIPPLIFFATSHVIGQAVLVDRYFLHTVAAQAIIVALLFAAFPR